MFFLCALILISVVATESFKDENKFGATEESKTKIRTDGWKWEDLGNWGGWGLGENGGRGDKEGGHGRSGKDKDGKWEDLGNWGGWGLGENRGPGQKERGNVQGGSAQAEGGTGKERKGHRSRFSNGDSINLGHYGGWGSGLRSENGGRRRRP
ncbi:nodule specific protein [Trifolium pratense]|nr:nodule specific protein [Trifolium pratense]